MNKQEAAFVATVREFYAVSRRAHLPWRKTIDPYRIVVSEIMLQQTQVDRVLPKYKAFIAAFPSTKALAEASLGDVLRLWQGLGYNRRAKLLHQCARQVRTDYGGRWPRTYEGLVALPGIGPYTAAAVMAFAYNQPVPLIETNVRTVYLHHFFAGQTGVAETAILALVEKTLDIKDPRTWYWALMDYGSYLKRTHGNPNQRAQQYQKQSTFKNSNRQIRGAIIRVLTDASVTRAKLQKTLSEFDAMRVAEQLEKLEAEALVKRIGRVYSLPG